MIVWEEKLEIEKETYLIQLSTDDVRIRAKYPISSKTPIDSDFQEMLRRQVYDMYIEKKDV